VVNLINQERQAQGLAPLQVHNALQTAARGHSQDMACNDFFGHTGSDGSTPWDRAVRAGYNPTFIGENLYMGSGIHIGVGYIYNPVTGLGYVTAMFGKP